MRNFFEKHVILAGVTATLASLVLNYGIRFGTELLGISFGTTNAGFFVREFVIKVLPALAIAFAFGTIRVLQHPLRGFGKSLLSGAWILIVATLVTCVFLSGALGQGQNLKGAPEIIFYVLFLLMVGLSEELLLRGTVLRLFLDHYGEKGKGMVLSVTLSAALFGLCHFSNVFSGQGLYNTVLQMIGAFMMGLLFGAVYAKRGNLYGVMVLHAIIDFMTLCENGLLAGNSLADANASSEPGSLFWTLVSNGTFAIAAIVIMLHKKKDKSEKKEIC
jgi:membrane protease YdiL (CAAX protease family)